MLVADRCSQPFAQRQRVGHQRPCIDWWLAERAKGLPAVVHALNPWVICAIVVVTDSHCALVRKLQLAKLHRARIAAEAVKSPKQPVIWKSTTVRSKASALVGGEHAPVWVASQFARVSQIVRSVGSQIWLRELERQHFSIRNWPAIPRVASDVGRQWARNNKQLLSAQALALDLALTQSHTFV